MKTELVLGTLTIAAGIVLRFTGLDRPFPIELWQAVTWTGAAFLAMGLVRDLWIVATKTREKPVKKAGEKTLCFESGAGMLLVAAGLALLAVGVKRPFAPEAGWLVAYAGVLLIANGWTKDLVLVFRREKDHLNLIPW